MRVLCVDLKDNQPVVAILVNATGTENVETFSSTGGYHLIDVDSEFDLIEYNPWSEVPKYTPAWVRGKVDDSWSIRFFSQVDQDGAPLFSSQLDGYEFSYQFATLTRPESNA